MEVQIPSLPVTKGALWFGKRALHPWWTPEKILGRYQSLNVPQGRYMLRWCMFSENVAIPKPHTASLPRAPPGRGAAVALRVPFKARGPGKPPPAQASLGEKALPLLSGTLGITHKIVYGSDFRVTQVPPASLGKTALQASAASLVIEGFLAQW